MGKFSSCIAGIGLALSIGAATSNAATVQEAAASLAGDSQLNSVFTLTSLRVDELIDVNPLFRDVFTFDLRPGVNGNQKGVIMDYNPVHHGGVGMGFLIVEGMPDLSFSSGLPSPVAAVPEPAEWMLMALGLGALLYGCRRLRRAYGPVIK